MSNSREFLRFFIMIVALIYSTIVLVTSVRLLSFNNEELYRECQSESFRTCLCVLRHGLFESNILLSNYSSSWLSVVTKHSHQKEKWKKDNNRRKLLSPVSNQSVQPSSTPIKVSKFMPTTLPTFRPVSEVPSRVAQVSLRPSPLMSILTHSNVPSDHSTLSLDPTFSHKPSLSSKPSTGPVLGPSANPSKSFLPSIQPSSSLMPTSSVQPSTYPTILPSVYPSFRPTLIPSILPSMEPTPNEGSSIQNTMVMTLSGIPSTMNFANESRRWWQTITSAHVQRFWRDDLLHSPVFVHTVQTSLINETLVFNPRLLDEQNVPRADSHLSIIRYWQNVTFAIITNPDMYVAREDLQELGRELVSLPFTKNSLPYTNLITTMLNDTRPVILVNFSVIDNPTTSPVRVVTPIERKRYSIIFGVVSAVVALLIFAACSVVYLIHFKKPVVAEVDGVSDLSKIEVSQTPPSISVEQPNVSLRDDGNNNGFDHIKRSHISGTGSGGSADFIGPIDVEGNPKQAFRKSSIWMNDDLAPPRSEFRTLPPPLQPSVRVLDNNESYRFLDSIDHSAASSIPTNLTSIGTTSNALAWGMNLDHKSNGNDDEAVARNYGDRMSIEYESEKSCHSSSAGSNTPNGYYKSNNDNTDKNLILTPKSDINQRSRGNSSDTESSDIWTPHLDNFQLDIQELE